MKKIFLLIFSILTAFFVLNSVQAINVSDFTPALDKKVASLKTTEEKVKYLKSFSDCLNATKYTKSKDAQVYKKLREYALNMLNVFENDAARASNFSASILDIEKSNTKKHKSRFIRSAKVDCHAGAPAGGGSSLRLAILLTSRSCFHGRLIRRIQE